MESNELIAVAQVTDVVPTMVSSVSETRKRLSDLQAFVKEIMVEGSDFGKIPGTPKPTLLKPGAEKLCEVYGLAPRSEVTQRIEEWDRGFFFYEIRCDLISKRTGQLVASALGSCNSMEARYRWRTVGRICPSCGAEAIIESKFDTGGFYCFPKKGGCDAKIKGGSPEAATLAAQQPSKVENDDPYTLVNTILKMADKRAQVAATLKATRSSDLFTQDIEDMGDQIRKSSTTIQQPQRTSDTKPHTGNGGSAVISDPQSKRLYALYRKGGHADEDVKLWLKAVYNVEHSRDIKRSDYDTICARVQDEAPLAMDWEQRDPGTEG